MTAAPIPPIGGHAPPLRCGRLLRWPDPASQCPAEPRWHVLWTSDGENSLQCDEHRTASKAEHVYIDAHRYEMTCSMPGAVWVFDENVCVIDEDQLGLRQAEEVLARG